MAVGDLTAQNRGFTDYPCASFDGVDDKIAVSYSQAYLGNNLSNGFTISMFLKPFTTGENNGMLLNYGDDTSATNGIYLRMNGTIGSTTRVSCVINAGTARDSGSGSLEPVNTWHHVLVTVSSAAVVTWYIDGVQSGTPGSTGVISGITTSNVLTIGNRSGATDRTINGLIRDVRFYNRVLTQAEITRLENNEDIRESLIGYWKLNGNALDSSGNGNDGTVSGAIFRNASQREFEKEIAEINLTATTDKLIVVPTPESPNQFTIFGVNRASS